MSDGAASVQAWKPNGESHITPCNWDDKAATKFDVKYAGAYYGMPLSFDSKLVAEDVCRALNRCHEAGQMAKLAELRRFLGV